MIYAFCGPDRPAVGKCCAAAPEAACSGGPPWPAVERYPGRAERDTLGAANRSPLVRPPRAIPLASNVPPVVPALEPRPHDGPAAYRPTEGHGPTGWNRLGGSLHRRQLRRREKGGPKVGKTRRGKGTKWMAVVDGHGLPLGITIESASAAEVRLAEDPIRAIPGHKLPERIIGDKAYDSDGLAARLWDRYGIELIAPHRSNRKV